MISLEEVLRKSIFASTLNEQEIKKLVNFSKKELEITHHKKGEELYPDNSPSLYYVLEGLYIEEVELPNIDDWLCQDIINKDGIFGNIFTDHDSSWIAKKDSYVLKIPREKMEELSKKIPTIVPIIYELQHEQIERYRNISIMRSSRLKLQEKTNLMLDFISTQIGVVDPKYPDYYRINGIDQKEMAELIGITRETMCKMLSPKEWISRSGWIMKIGRGRNYKFYVKKGFNEYLMEKINSNF